MTERLRAEEEALRQKVAEVEAATEELRRAQDTLVRSERLASVGRLAAGLAHEIGNPITAMLGLLDLLLEGGLDEAERRDFLERLKRETDRVHQVLRDLLAFARPAVKDDADAQADAQSRTSVAQAVAHVVALVRPQKSFADVQVQASIDEDLPPVTIGASRIEQVLLNLLLNAADAAPTPGGRVIVEAQASKSTVRITIEDNGGGIAPSVRQRLFEPFVTTKEPGKGTGLGLAVCRGLIEAAGGHIDVEDGTEGARFVMELPQAQDDEEPQQ
jgi:signal transduction histidine kinase